MAQHDNMKRIRRLAVFLVSLICSFLFAAALVLSGFRYADRLVNPPELVGPGYTDAGMGILMLLIGMPALVLITTVCTIFLNGRLKVLARRWL